MLVHTYSYSMCLLIRDFIDSRRVKEKINFPWFVVIIKITNVCVFMFS